MIDFKVKENNLLIELLAVEEKTENNLLILDRRSGKKNYGRIVQVGRATQPIWDCFLVGQKVIFRADSSIESGVKMHVIIPSASVICIDKGSELSDLSERFYIPWNYVLVKPVDNTKIKTKSGFEFFIDTSWEKEKTAATTGEVIALPQKLYFNGNKLKKPSRISEFMKQSLIKTSVDYDTDIEIEKGDFIHWHYLQIGSAQEVGAFISVFNGVRHETYYFIKYDRIFCWESEALISPVNGYVFVAIEAAKPKEQTTDSGLVLVSLEEKEKNKNWGQGVVKFAGQPLRGYLQYPTDVDTNQLSVGDKVYFPKFRRAKVGQDTMIATSGAYDLHRLHRRDIHFID